MSQSAPGWYPDPQSPEHHVRYWDGSAWTSQTRSAPSPDRPTLAQATATPGGQSTSAQQIAGRTPAARPARAKRQRSAICEIDVQYGRHGVFFARACGPRGVYTAAESVQLKLQSGGFAGDVIQTDEARAALNGLLARLWTDGWEPTASGKNWFRYRLRRAVLEE